MTVLRWEHYPLVRQQPQTQAWLTLQSDLGLSTNTIEVYGRALQDFLAFCEKQPIDILTVRRDHIAHYIRELGQRPTRSATGLSNATLQQRLTVLRLFYDYLREEGVREDHPVGRGSSTSGRPARGLLPRHQTLPWIPSDEEWVQLLKVVRQESLRNRTMFALAYDAGLRREELCALETSDIDPARRLLHIRAETTKNRLARVIPYSATASTLYSAYLQERRQISRARGPLFLSESPRNYAQAITIWTWSKVVHSLSIRAELTRFSTHTLRHLCLTDLARANWDIHDIATFAGHGSLQSTLRYIHLSGRDLAAKLERSMAHVHTWRVETLGEHLT